MGGRGRGPERRSSALVLDRESGPCFQVRKLLSAGEKIGPKSLRGKSSRRGSENWGELQRSIFEPRRWETILPPGCGGGETSLAKQSTSSLAALDSIPLSPGCLENLVPRTAARAHSILCKVRSIFLPPSQTPTNYFADLSNTDEGHFNYITHERSPEAMSCLRAHGRIAA